MIARITTVAFIGIEALAVDVQIMLAPGKMGMSIVGLPDKIVAESRERVQAALHASGLSMPVKRVTINLAPADLPKEGSHYDLPIAVGLMMSMGLLPATISENYIILGELALDGHVTQVNGVLPAAMTATALGRGLICPSASGSEAAWASQNLEIIAPHNLLSLANHFKGTQRISRPIATMRVLDEILPDLSEIKGQIRAKRALEVAASGRHNLLFIGPPGAGKSMLALRLPSILPPLDSKELLDISLIASVAGKNNHGALSNHRPFRSPHHSASMAAMIGGGQKAKPGEISLAHNGILFLDEFPEFAPKVLDSLRQPLESGECIIARANYHIRYPARIQLIAAMNPCRCGMSGVASAICARGPRCQTDYQARISGPLLDRIDLRVDVPALSTSELMQQTESESSASVAQRVLQARIRQRERFTALGYPQIHTNSDCPVALIEKIAVTDADATNLLRKINEKTQLSARSYHRILKVARTIADLDCADSISRSHLAEALSYRSIPASGTINLTQASAMNLE